jgi:two-component system, response regulator PdtaR
MGLSDQSVAVLVVEDEPLTCMDVAATFEDAGFKVYEAANTDEAIGLLEEFDDIHVLVTDLDMPGSIDGLELAHYARSCRLFRIIVISGHRNIAMRVPSSRRGLPEKAVWRRPYSRNIAGNGSLGRRRFPPARAALIDHGFAFLSLTPGAPPFVNSTPRWQGLHRDCLGARLRHTGTGRTVTCKLTPRRES